MRWLPPDCIAADVGEARKLNQRRIRELRISYELLRHMTRRSQARPIEYTHRQCIDLGRPEFVVSHCNRVGKPYRYLRSGQNVIVEIARGAYYVFGLEADVLMR